MSIRDCSNEVSFKSACVANVFANEPPNVVCEVLNKETPSPESKESVEGSQLISGAAAFTCFEFAIDLAKAFVYLEASLS